MTTYFDEWRDVSLTPRRTLVPYVNILNLHIKLQLKYAQSRPSKQSRKEALSRANYYSKQRDAIFNLYPEHFL